MILLLQREGRGKGAAAPFPCTPNPRSTQAFTPLRTFSVDDAEHFLHNHHASVASLRLLFTFAPEWRSASLPESMFTFTGIPTETIARALGRKKHDEGLVPGEEKLVHFLDFSAVLALRRSILHRQPADRRFTLRLQQN